jgi:hypothetical protein
MALAGAQSLSPEDLLGLTPELGMLQALFGVTDAAPELAPVNRARKYPAAPEEGGRRRPSDDVDDDEDRDDLGRGSSW